MNQSIEMRMSVLSKVGGRQRNEDSCGYWGDDTQTCVVLSDGAGGHGGGDVASQLVVETILKSFKEQQIVNSTRSLELLHAANKAVIGQQPSAPELHDMRATVVLTLIDIQRAEIVWGHIGDSRLYGFSKGNLHFQTRDHSVFQSMVDAGYVKEGNARDSAQRTVLTGSVGGEEGFTPDVSDYSFDIRPGDAYLLCSDGFWEYVDEQQMEAQLQFSGSPEDWLARMEAVLLELKREGHDNYSAIAIWFGDMDFSTRILV